VSDKKSFRRDDGERQKFVFLAHWVEISNYWLWFSKSWLHDDPLRMRLLIPFWPFAAIMSVFYFVGKKAYNVVDRFNFNGQLRGETWLIRNFAWHFMIKSWQSKIRNRILKAVLSAQENGFQVIGLGALTKAEWLTEGGKWIVDKLGDKLRVPIVHGDTLTAAAVYRRVLELQHLYHLTENPSVFITGGTSKIGRAVALALVKSGVKVYLYTQSSERFAEIASEATQQDLLVHATSFKDGASCSLWITGKAESGVGKKIIANLPQGAVVLNFSVPDPLTPSLLRQRRDVHHFDGGLIAYDKQRTGLFFTMRLTRGITYACHAGTMVHAYLKWTHHEVGPVDICQMDVVWEAALDLGMTLPRFTSHLKDVVLVGVESSLTRRGCIVNVAQDRVS